MQPLSFFFPCHIKLAAVIKQFQTTQERGKRAEGWWSHQVGARGCSCQRHGSRQMLCRRSEARQKNSTSAPSFCLCHVVISKKKKISLSLAQTGCSTHTVSACQYASLWREGTKSDYCICKQLLFEMTHIASPWQPCPVRTARWTAGTGSDLTPSCLLSSPLSFLLYVPELLPHYVYILLASTPSHSFPHIIKCKEFICATSPLPNPFASHDMSSLLSAFLLGVHSWLMWARGVCSQSTSQWREFTMK